jgi:pyruvate,water dikinase
MANLRDLFLKDKSCHPLVNLEGKIAETYRHYRDFLTHNQDALNLISEFELTYHVGQPFSFAWVKKQSEALMKATRHLVISLDRLSQGRYKDLLSSCDRLEEDILSTLAAEPHRPSGPLVLPLEALTPESAPQAGTKATNLALIGRVLGLPTPPGFVITASAYVLFIEQNDLSDPIEEMLASLATDDLGEVEVATKEIRDRIRRAPVPPSVAQEIFAAYEALESKTRKNVSVAMRSSAVGEDTLASFAGQYLTVLNVGRDNLLDGYRGVVAGKYAPRAILYRLRHGLEDRATPMCVAGIQMVDARASGVMYTADPSRPEGSEVVINAVLGLGERLVSGEASPDLYYVDTLTGDIVRREIQRKDKRLVRAEAGGTRTETVGKSEQRRPAISDDIAQSLARFGAKIEGYFGTPQDVEWCVDQTDRLHLLQSRPLHMASRASEKKAEDTSWSEDSILLKGGTAACGGTAVGRVWISDRPGAGPSPPEDAILVTRTASPEYAKFVGRVKGLITDIGGIATHLASVAREFGIPALFNTGRATMTLSAGEWVTLAADRATVYAGRVPTQDNGVRKTAGAPFETPSRRRLRTFLEKVSPLHLTDPEAPSFSPEHCRTIHDIIRFAHEKVVNEMFGLSGDTRGAVKSTRMTANIPLQIYFVDLGGGLESDLTTCDKMTPDAIQSVPMKALWRGVSHPGVSWSGTVNVTPGTMMALMTSGPTPALNSYALVSGEYLNFSIKFGYHYANIDCFCGENADQNYIMLQFGGGAGSYYGRVMRINFLAEVLQRLEFTLSLSGDRLDGSLRGYDMKTMEQTLDQVGRLLASTRLLDLAIPGQAEVSNMTAKFFEGNYDFLQSGENPLPGFYTPIGHWERISRNGGFLCLQDGSKWGDPFSCGLKIVMGKLIGSKYQKFLDWIHAHYYFPIAIAKQSALSTGSIRARIMVEGGCLDRVGGLAFGVKDAGNYFVLAVDALQNHFTLFQFMKSRPSKKAGCYRRIETGQWYVVKVEIGNGEIHGYLNSERLIEYEEPSFTEGYAGFWTKSDSRIYFDELEIKEEGKARLISF